MGVIFILPGVILLFFSLVIGMEIFTDWKLYRIQKKTSEAIWVQVSDFSAERSFLYYRPGLSHV